MSKVKIEEDNLSLQRITSRCIDCGQCLATCTKLNHLNKEDCINCGQCILTCPVGALVPKYNYKEVLANIRDEEKVVIVSTSPAVRVSIGDEFGYEAGEFLEEKMVGVLKALGFDYVFDTTFGADLTTMEEASELISRLNRKENLPMFTSCCPSWVLFMEKYYPEDLSLLSTCKSPIEMQGAMIKNYVAKVKNLNPNDIVTVALTPCVSKKSEIKKYKDQNTDYVLTTSELALLIRESNIDFKTVENKKYDSLLQKGTGSGVIFGASGGVMQAAIRTAYYLLNQEEAPEDLLSLENLQGTTEIKEVIIDLKKAKLKVAVVYGLHTVQQNYNALKKYDFIEVMTCPNGCVGGGGQPILPIQKQANYVKARGKSLYEDDKISKNRSSYQNPDIEEIYQTYLEHPLSEKSKELLHTNHQKQTQKVNS